MATSRLIELETGTFTKRRHSHNGHYGHYGGDFWTHRHAMQATTSVNDSYSGELHGRPVQRTGRVVRPKA